MINLPKGWFYFLRKRLVELKFKKQLLKLGQNVVVVRTVVGYNNYISGNCILGNVNLGDYSYTGIDTQIFYTKIGKFCSIANNVKIGLGSHPVDRVSTHPSFYASKKVFKCFPEKPLFEEYKETTIGNDVWVGSSAIVFGGLTIGDGAVIAGGAVVTKNVEPYSIVGGNPAKILRYRFDETTIKKLMEFKWWEKDLPWVEANYKAFNNMNDFLSLIDK